MRINDIRSGYYIRMFGEWGYFRKKSFRNAMFYKGFLIISVDYESGFYINNTNVLKIFYK